MSRHRHQILMGVSAFLCAALFGACATAGKMAGKAVWFAVESGVRLTGAAVHGVTRVVGMESKHVIDLTADAATRLWAEQESKKLAEMFWMGAEHGAYESCYNLLSNELKRKLPRERFKQEAGQWAGRIKMVRILPVTVQPDHVEVPTELSAPAEGTISTVRLIVVPVQTGWKILSWIVQR